MNAIYDNLKNLYQFNRNLIAQIELINHKVTDLMEQAFHAFPDLSHVSEEIPPVPEVTNVSVAEPVPFEESSPIPDNSRFHWPAPGSDVPAGEPPAAMWVGTIVPTEEVKRAVAIPQPASTIVYPDSPQNTGVVTVRYE